MEKDCNLPGNHDKALNILRSRQIDFGNHILRKTLRREDLRSQPNFHIFVTDGLPEVIFGILGQP